MSIETNVEQESFQTGRVSLISTIHAVHDTYTTFLPVLLPVLIQKFTLTNTAAGLLSVFMQLPSLLQPLIGNLADRKNLRLLIILTPALTGTAMSLLSIAPTYGFLIFLLVLAGISSASLHAIGPVLGSTFSGNKLGKGMSFWMVGGELGRALGPMIIVTAIAYLTLDGLPWLLLAGVLTSIFLFGKLNSITTLPHQNHDPIDWKTALRKMRNVMVPLVILIFSRSMAVATFTTFLPTYLTMEGSSLWMAGASLTILEVSGMAGIYFAGGFSDKYGRRRILTISFIVSPILIILFIQSKGLWQFPLLILLGFFVISITPVIMAIVLENFPDNRSLANGVYMAFTFILFALAILLVGFLSDLVNMRFAFLVSAGLLLLGIPFIHLLPKSIKKH